MIKYRVFIEVGGQSKLLVKHQLETPILRNWGLGTKEVSSKLAYIKYKMERIENVLSETETKKKTDKILKKKIESTEKDKAVSQIQDR